MNINRIGVLAGRGMYPFLTVKSAKEHGIGYVSVVAVKDDADPDLSNFADNLDWVNAGADHPVLQQLLGHE